MEKVAKLKKNVKLRPHQEEFIHKYEQQGGRQLAMHSLGSGKTITSIAATERIGAKRPLILTPAALQKNYADTINQVVEKKDQKKYHVMSYEKFRRNPDKFLKEVGPDSITVDEFHRDKDPKSVSYKALLRARPHVQHFLGLSGTPIQNNPSEAFPLVGLVAGDPKAKIPTKEEFEKKYTKIEKVYPKGMSGIIARMRGMHGERKVLTHAGELQAKMAPFIHKNDPSPEFLSNFPKVDEKNIEVPMTKEQQKRYDFFMKKDLGFFDRWRIKHDLPPLGKGSGSFFSKLTHARQISNTPTVLSKSLGKEDGVEHSGKLQELYKNLNSHLKAHKKHKVMVYSNFTESGLAPIEKRLKEDKIPYGVFSGKVKKKDKNQDVEDYNSGKKRVLLVSPSGAEGLDLKGTTMLQNIDQSWNPAKNNQVKGRSARFKSHEALPPAMRKVQIQNYLSTVRPGLIRRMLGLKAKDKSIDQYIQNRAREKQDLNDQFGALFS